MSSPATNSSIDVTYWFFCRAEQDDVYLENEKLHHLLFLAQLSYARKHNGDMFMPSVFLCDEQGIFEPNIKRILTQGRPFMPPVRFDENISAFLEQLWQDFGHIPQIRLKQAVTALPLYSRFAKKGTVSVIPWNSLVDKSDECGTIQLKEDRHLPKKVLVSQNGPVVVSQWNPRKVSRVNNKDYLHE